MIARRRVFVSMTYDSLLNDQQNQVKWAIVRMITDAGFEPNFFFPYLPPAYQGDEDEVNRISPWSGKGAEEVISGCVGAAMLGYPRWKTSDEGREISLPSEYTHYEAGMTYALGVPMFMALEEGTPWRGAFNDTDQHICEIPLGADLGWLDSPMFKQAFSTWLNRVKARRDLFLGYSSGAEGTAKNLSRLLTEKGATVLDWADFDAGTILEQIEIAANRCSGGVFLFTKDDRLEGEGAKAAPRDNVVFEAGYFVHAKGQKRVLIVRQEGAKMPADLGGAIYAPLPDLANIDHIGAQVDKFLRAL